MKETENVICKGVEDFKFEKIRELITEVRKLGERIKDLGDGMVESTQLWYKLYDRKVKRSR